MADCYIDYRDFNRQAAGDFNEDIYFDFVRRSGASTDSLLFNFVGGNTTNIAEQSLKFTNDNSHFYFQPRIITNDSFNVPGGGQYNGLSAENCYNINLEGNVFTLPKSSAYTQIGATLKNSAIATETIQTSGYDPEEDLDAIYILNIVNNKFFNGTVSLLVTGYTSNILPYYIAYNTFNQASLINLLLKNVSGKIRNNNFTSTATPTAIQLVGGNPTFYKNTIKSRDATLRSTAYSYPNLSPYRSEDLIWTSGNNSLYSYLTDNVYLTAGTIFTDFGHNTFNANNGDGKHIYGHVDTNIDTLYARENCWLNIGPQIEVAHIGTSNPIPAIYANYGFTCARELVSEETYDIKNLGYGTFDTTISSENNTGTIQNEEDVLYVQGYEYLNNGFFIDAILNNKQLIDNYPNSFYLETVLYDLYSAYECLDTTSDQSYKNTLYGNLNSYLNDKIASELYNSAFEDISYELTLMCLSNMEEYDDALNGYEFLALFHPDPDIRISASWDYEEIEELLGYGGAEKNSTNEISGVEFKNQIESKEFKRIEKIINDDPKMKRLKESYVKTSSERTQKIENIIREESKNEKDFEIYSKRANEIDNLKQDRARKNLFELKHLSNEQLEKRRIDDLLIMAKDFRNEKTNIDNLSLPFEYKLSQNFPNPFNPVTTIHFQIPEDGIVNIKVYDVAGREIKTLINDFKQVGTYSVVFDGTNFASGVYFYRLLVSTPSGESNKFVETKRMIMIK